MKGVLDDALVISCHYRSDNAKWVGPSHAIRCSICGSIHPTEFAKRIKEGVKPSTTGSAAIRVGEDVFDFQHLQDMPNKWLSDHAAEIFLASGLVFWWDRERFKFKRFPLPLTDTDKQAGMKVLR